MLESRQLPGHAFMVLLLFGVIVLAWTPSLVSMVGLSQDQVFHSYWFSVACRADPISLGWLGQAVSSRLDGLFALSLLAMLQQYLACSIAPLLRISTVQSYLILALLLLSITTYYSCRQACFSRGASLMVAFLLATAPCSFSRLGHLDQAILIPVVPSLIACWRLNEIIVSMRHGMLASCCCGFLASALTLPSQEYYVVFSVLILVSSWLLIMLRASALGATPKCLRGSFWLGLSFIIGFASFVAIAFLPKLVAVLGQGPPQQWMTPRYVIEQFRYGLLPFTWFVPSVLVDPLRQYLSEQSLPVHYESYFWSTGSLLIPIACIFALRRLWVPVRVGVSDMDLNLDNEDPFRGSPNLRFFATLLLLVVALALVCMTMGGLGTLLAAFVTPVLRSLNRFTVFVYGASVIYLVAEFDTWLRQREPLR